MLCSSKASSRLNLARPIYPMWLCCVTQSCPTLCDPKDWSPPDSPVHGDSPGKNPGVGLHAPPTPGYRPNPGMEPRSPAFQEDSLLPELPGKPLTQLLSFHKQKYVFYSYFMTFPRSKNNESQDVTKNQ